MNPFGQIGLLVWKNFLIQRRQPIWTLFQLLLPVFFSLLLLILRVTLVTTATHEDTIFEPFSPDFLSLYTTNGSLADQFFPTQIAFTPNTTKTNKIMQNGVNTINYIVQSSNFSISDILQRLNITDNPCQNFTLKFEVKGFNSEKDMEDFLLLQLEEYKKDDDNHIFNCASRYLGGVTFGNGFANGSSKSPTYDIRLSNTPRNSRADNVGGKSNTQNSLTSAGWMTQLQYPTINLPGPRDNISNNGGTPGYWREGFLSLQQMVDMSILLNLLNPSKLDSDSVDRAKDVQMLLSKMGQLSRYPFPSYFDNPYVIVVQQNLPVFLMLSLIVTVLYIARNVCQEKEKRLKEYMGAMGLGRISHWSAHFISNFALMVVTMALVTFLLCCPFGGAKVIDNSDWSVVFVFLLLYGIATIWYSFTVSTFFKSGNVAAGIAFIIYFLLYLPYFLLQPRYATLSANEKLLPCLLLNTAMSFGSFIIGAYEGLGTGLQWSTINTPASTDDTLTMLDISSVLKVYLMLIVDIFICMLISWYVEAVYPGDEGVPQPFYFPFMPSYWCGSIWSKKSTAIVHANGIYSRENQLNFEPDPDESIPQIDVEQLTKIFGRGEKKNVAVDHLNLTGHQGKITALLGHNGAGKSTTMLMLTGVIPPTSGKATVCGFDLHTELNKARRHIGLCPQFNVLFDQLTVDEHLEFFCKLKGRKYSKTEVDGYLEVLGLTPKRSAMAATLSGGMKRKLSVAIALVGGSEVVMLDEPTAGMDPGARHDCWHLLQKQKVDRTILLSTHYMEEADLLGDRIAILAKGQLQCCGSPLFLKSRYGAGYHVTVVFASHSVTVQSDLDEVVKVVNRHCPNGRLESTVGSEAIFLLVQEDRQNFQTLFEELEKNQNLLGITSLGVSVTTMEEVFIRVGEAADAKAAKLNENVAETYADIEHTELPDFASVERTVGVKLVFQQLYGQLVKRLRFSSRNFLVLFGQVIFPLLIFAAGLIINKTLPGPSASPRLSVSFDPFRFINLITFRPVNIYSAVSPYANSPTDQHGCFLRNNDSLIGASSTLVDFGQLSRQEFLHKIVNETNRIGLSTFDLHNVVSIYFDENDTILALFNAQAYHTPPLALNLLSNLHLRCLFELLPDIQIRTGNFPLPPTTSDSLDDYVAAGVIEFQLAFNLIVSMSFMTASFLVFITTERATGAKHLQLMANCHPATYWAANFLWDFASYLVLSCALLILLAAFDVGPLIHGFRAGHIALLLILYGCAQLPFVYFFSFAFNTAAGAFIKLVIFNIISGIIPLVVLIVLYLLNDIDVANTLEWVFLVLFPNFALGQTITKYYMNDFLKQTCAPMPDLCKPGLYTDDYLSWSDPGVGRFYFFLALQSCIFACLVGLAEFGYVRSAVYAVRHCHHRIWAAKRSKRQISAEPLVDAEHFAKGRSYASVDAQPAGNGNLLRLASWTAEDSDIAEEKFKVARMAPVDARLLVRNLTKDYGALRAVDHLNFSIGEAECFGLLGVNGAGKTSTFQMLTGDNPITDGEAFVCGFDLSTNWRKAGTNIGYCPQFDALIDQLTGRESLTLFARLRGIPEGKIADLVSSCLNAVGLGQYADRISKAYSGGNRRKLSLGLGLIGSPPAVLLDEPTSGVDPIARRQIWSILAAVKRGGAALLLSSHSMEECEALCDRIAILAAGQLKCVGTAQRLKTKFGLGGSLVLKVAEDNQVEVAVAHVTQLFPDGILEEVHQRQIRFRIPQANVSWARLFGVVEQMRSDGQIVDYSVSQTSLEQIFLSLTHRTAQNPIVD